jgi:hypothetical protein
VTALPALLTRPEIAMRPARLEEKNGRPAAARETSAESFSPQYNDHGRFLVMLQMWPNLLLQSCNGHGGGHGGYGRGGYGTGLRSGGHEDKMSNLACCGTFREKFLRRRQCVSARGEKMSKSSSVPRKSK